MIRAVFRLAGLILPLFAILWSPRGYSVSARENLKTAGARESCRQDIAGLYLSAINDLDYAAGTLQAARRSLAQNRQAVTKARQTLKAKRAIYDKNPADFQQKHAVDGAFFRVSQLDRQAAILEGVIAEQKASQDRARRSRQHIGRSIAQVFRVIPKKNAPYSVQIRYKEPCGRFKYICPPTKAEVAAIRRLFKDQPMTRDCQKFLGHLDQP